MVLGFDLRTPSHGSNTLESLDSIDLHSYYQIQSEQLTNHNPILCTRIVYYDCVLREAKEVVSYTQSQSTLTWEFLDYLRSEEWLTEYPMVGEIHQFALNNFQLVSCICPLSYKNKKPEYIQIISCDYLERELQAYIKNVAILVSKYEAIYLGYLRQKSEINLLEQVLHKIGHQLRNSLSLIGLYSHNLYLGLQDKSCKEQARTIHDKIQDLDKNLTEIINCSQSEKLKVSQQDLRNIVIESIKDLQPLIVKKQLQISIPDTSTKLEVDRLQIKQVFDNLLSNAAHFSPNSGTISCDWQVFKEEVFIQVSDQGRGISPEDLPNIFNPFYSHRSGGTGLGLTIAKKIVLDHQGSLWAKNLLGSGAQFSLILPRKKVSS
ncbi:MAG: HAMP domain-containing sensor histidine kinase [Rivularia sp. (in: cyanobacteria)]